MTLPDDAVSDSRSAIYLQSSNCSPDGKRAVAKLVDDGVAMRSRRPLSLPRNTGEWNTTMERRRTPRTEAQTTHIFSLSAPVTSSKLSAKHNNMVRRTIRGKVMLTRSCHLLVAVLLASASLRAQTPSYTSIEISSPAGAADNVTASGINGHGDIVGMSGASPFVYYHASGAELTLEGFAVYGISDFDKIAGEIVNPTAGPQAVVWSENGGVEVLPAETFSEASAISNDGDVAGSIDNGHADTLAVMWRSKPTPAMVPLGVLWEDPAAPDYATSAVAAINGLSHIAGLSTAGAGTDPNTAEAFGIHAFLYRDGKMLDLGALALSGNGSDDSEGYGLNDLDEVVGASTTAFPALNSQGATCPNCGVATHAFLWRAGKMQDLGNLAGVAGWNSQADSINDREEIVGWADSNVSGVATQRAFLYTGGRMLNLQFYVHDLDPDVRLTEAVGINCEGWIVANGYNVTTPNQTRVYLLIRQGSPRPECAVPPP
jgi:probable HAF family extracellular repeat protein